jgi:hypothetical protein
MNRFTVWLCAWAAGVWLILASSAPGGINVQLVETEPDGATWVTELNALTAAVGFGALNAAERVQFQNKVLDTLTNAYTIPGVAWNMGWGGPNAAFEQIYFTRAPAAGVGAYGDADRLDWRNLTKNGTARIYLQNFDGVLTAINGQAGMPRATKIDLLGVAVGMTTAHELAHNLGLFHRDCYATELIHDGNWAATGGWQKRHIMAAGPSGLGDNMDRTVERYFNEFERAKLGYAEDLVAAPPASRNEALAGDAGNNAAAATAINWSPVVTSDLLTANFIGTLPAGDQDWFWFDAPGGTKVIAHLMSTDIALDGRLANPVDARISLYRQMPGGALALLFANDDFRFDDDTAYAAADGENSLDPFILNYRLPITARYFLQVELAAAGGSNYELFVTIPTPGAAGLLGLGLLFAVRRRR